MAAFLETMCSGAEGGFEADGRAGLMPARNMKIEGGILIGFARAVIIVVVAMLLRLKAELEID